MASASNGETSERHADARRSGVPSSESEIVPAAGAPGRDGELGAVVGGRGRMSSNGGSVGSSREIDPKPLVVAISALEARPIATPIPKASRSMLPVCERCGRHQQLLQLSKPPGLRETARLPSGPV